MPEHGDAGALARRRRISRAHYATLGELFDPTTFRHLDALGLRAGWRCWEVGAGGPTVPAGLAEEADLSLQPLACPDEAGPAERLASKLRRVATESRGDNLAFGRTLLRLLRAAGLTEVGADAYFPVAGAASGSCSRR